MPARGDSFGDRFGPSELIHRGAPASLHLHSGLSRGPSPVPLPPAGTADVFTGTAGNDTFVGTGGSDVFQMADGGNDTVKGKKDGDVFQFGAALTFQDSIDGGAGNDTLVLAGNYAFGLVFEATTMTGVETVSLGTGFDYSLKFGNANVAAGNAVTLDARALAASDSLTFFGSSVVDGSLIVLGGGGADTVTIGQNGSDVVRTGAGADTVKVLGNLTAGCRIDGGADANTIVFNGDYSEPLVLGPKTIRNFTVAQFAAGHDYNIVFDDATAPSGILMLIDGSALGTGDTLNIDGSAETTDGYEMYGGAGADILTGGAQFDRLNGGGGDDIIDLQAGGSDDSRGGDGDDVFVFGASYNFGEIVRGDAGFDTVTLEGDYSTTFSFFGMEYLLLAPGHDYLLTIGLDTGTDLFEIDGSGLGAGDTVSFDGGGNDVVYFLRGGAGDDVLAGDDLDDTIDASTGGADNLSGEEGNDAFVLGATLTADDTIDGGDGDDLLTLDGDYLSPTLVQITSVEDVILGGGHDYQLVLAANAGTGTTTVDGSALGVGDVLDLDASDSTVGVAGLGGDGADVFKGGTGSDFFAGGDGGDRFRGSAGPDQIIPGTGANRFIYGGAADSTSTGFDAILGADLNDDKFDLPGTLGLITAIDPAVNTGALSSGSFDANLTVAMNGHLGASHAVLFTPNSGNLSGNTFLILDLNAAAGYQAGADLVVRLVASGTLDASDFI
jgi:Ca2+-binding RTX toxin-like protein